MKHTDEYIVATVRKILDVLHDTKTGFNAFRNELKKQHLKRNEYEKRIIDKQYELGEKYGLTHENSINEVKFRLTGKDVMASGLYVSCGQAAKAFCYVNSQLPKEQQLNLKVLFSTDTDHLIDAMAGHTLPCVKLSDGKWHAIEPQIKPEKEYPGFQFVCDNVQVGDDIWHQLSVIKAQGRPYKITKIVTPQEHENVYSDFGNFLDVSMVHTGKMKFICSALKIALQNHKKSNNGKKQIYDICKALNCDLSSVKVLAFIKNEKISYKIAIELDGIFYYVNPNVQYLSLRKIYGFDEWCNENGYKLQKTMAIADFVKECENKDSIKGRYL
ncbi:MAG: hypothetical protein MJ187_04555 [Alphaproteobacteria bacterium]|nr:hypothetical protein [Alphaproteobacteria bacterium]